VNGSHGGEQEIALAVGMATEVFGIQAEADFGVTPQRAGSAAREIGQSYVEATVNENVCVGKAALYTRGENRHPLFQFVPARGADFAGQYTGFRVALGEDESLASGSGAAVQKPVSPARKLSH
jgi:hypothetical protein